MNLNDNRVPLQINDAFDSNGELLIGNNGEEIGKELLERKMRGYVSYVRGQDPFSFPNAIYPSDYKSVNSLKMKLENEEWSYPTVQINEANIEDEDTIKFLDLFIVSAGIEQNKMYNYLVKDMKKDNPILIKNKNRLKFTLLDGPLQILNMAYPHPEFPDNGELSDDINITKELYGKQGLERVMDYNEVRKNEFEYVDDNNRLFSKENLIKYSGKLSVIIDRVEKSEGVVLIYSQYIDGGCIPIALALEEIGFTRYGDKSSLFKTPPKEQLMIKLTEDDENSYPAKYVMITGDSAISGRNKKELNACTDPKNINGEMVKVVIISKAGSEGLDFKNIRQVHILEPWYNFNRTRQTIGRAIRNLSHCNLIFSKRNTQIFLYAIELFNDGYIDEHDNQESVDLYMYRLAEKKGIKIGKVNKILKKNAVDCLLNHSQTQMSQKDTFNKKIKQLLSNGEEIEIILGDKDNSISCDFSTCNFQCNVDNDGEIDKHTFNDTFLNINNDIIIKKIKDLFKDKYLYTKTDLVKKINISKKYNIDEINSALDYMIEHKEYLIDKLNRIGKLKNVDKYYLFHPIDINETIALTSYKVRQPIPQKNKKSNIIISGDSKLLPLEEINSNFIEIVKKKILFILDMINISQIETKYNWIKEAKKVINNLKKINYFEEDVLKKYIIFHILDILKYNEKKQLLQIYLSKKDDIDREDEKINTYLKKYFDKYSIELNDKQYFLIRNDDDIIYKFKLLVLDENNLKEERMNSSLLKKIQEKFSISEGNINMFFGFMSRFKKSKTYVFKHKKLENIKNNIGRKCGGNKIKLINYVNYLYSLFLEIVDNDKKDMKRYFKSIDSSKFDKLNLFDGTKENILRLEPVKLCIEIELLFRYLDYEYNSRNEDIKKFHFSVLEENLYNLQKLPITDEDIVKNPNIKTKFLL